MNAAWMIAAAAILLGAAALVVVLRRRPQEMGGEALAQLGGIAEKLTQLAQIAPEMGQMRVDVARLAERVGSVEQNHSSVNQTLTSLSATVASTRASADSLVQTTNSIRGELGAAKSSLAAIQELAKSREQIQAQSAESIKRVESILTGSQSKGAAGENILDVFFSKLPAEWQVRNFAVGSNIVEFGIRLPDGLVLPIDSKWTATAIHQEFLGASDPKEKAAKKQQLQATVARRASEIRKYIDPNLTASFAIAVVPDPIFELCPELMPELLQQNVLLLSYSLFMPYLLLVFHNTLKTLKTVDLKRLDGYLHTAQGSITSLQGELEGRFSRALVMLENSRQDMAAQLSSLSGGMVALHVGSSALKPEALPEAEPETFKLAAPQ